MVFVIKRRQAMALGSAAAAMAAVRRAAGQAIPKADVAPPRLAPEKGASLRILRPSRFMESDEVIFRANTAKFAKETGIDVRVDFLGWEDIRQQAALSANTGSGPDIILGWADDPHVYSDKVSELTDVAEYLGKKYGGWMFLGEKYGKKTGTNDWIGLPFGGSPGPIAYRKSAVNEAGFDTIPNSHGDFLELCRRLKKINKPAGFALGNAFGDGNRFANWLIWSHGGSLVDGNGKVAINSKRTIAALEYLKDLYPTFVPGTLSWGDVSNDRAFAANELFLTANRVSLYLALKDDPATKAMAADTYHAPLMKGAIDKHPQSALVLNAMVFRHSRFQNAAKAYLTYMMEAEQYDTWLTGCLGYWAHPLKAYDASRLWDSDPKLAVCRDTMNNQFWGGYKGPITRAAGSVAAEYVLVQMCASVASGQATPAEAAKEAERRAWRYYR